MATQTPATVSVSLTAGSVLAIDAQQSPHSALALLDNPDAPSAPAGSGGGPGAWRLLGLTPTYRSARDIPRPLVVTPTLARQAPARCAGALFTQTQEEADRELEELSMLLMAMQ